MENTKTLIKLVEQVIKQGLVEPSNLDIFINYYVPILQLVLIVIGGGFALYKYIQTKNIEKYEKLLREVYSPLYMYIVKQETVRKLLKLNPKYNEVPILEITDNETNPLQLGRKTITDMLKNINVGVASKELITLLSVYEVCIYYEDTQKKNCDLFLEATIMKVNIENKLREEILRGYKKFHKKLGVKSDINKKFYNLTNSNIEILIDVSEEEKAKLRKEIENNPDLYK